MLAQFLNRSRMVAAYFGGRGGARLYPQEVVIELTNHCNLACVMCPQKDMTRSKGFMEEGLYRSIIDQVAGRTELVYLYGTGESVLHKQLPEYIAYAAGKGLTTCLSTNGLPLTEANARNILGSGLRHLIVALDGGTKQTYESIRIGGDFDKLVANIRLLLRLRREMASPTLITLQMIVMERNESERARFVALFDEEERRQVFQFRFKPHYETYAHGHEGVRHTRPCFWLWNMLSVSWTGDVQLCCMDYDVKGVPGLSLARQSVEDVWNSAAFERLRVAHKRLDYDSIPLCRGCDIPEQGYFSTASILATPLFDADQVRRLLPWYERLLLLKKKYGFGKPAPESPPS